MVTLAYIRADELFPHTRRPWSDAVRGSGKFAAHLALLEAGWDRAHPAVLLCPPYRTSRVLDGARRACALCCAGHGSTLVPTLVAFREATLAEILADCAMDTRG